MESASTSDFGGFHHWKNPDHQSIGKTALEFLQKLSGPTHIHISGKDPSRARAVVTLLHGNEPSGLHAIHEMLKHRVEPAVDIHYFIPSVDAAKQARKSVRELDELFTTGFRGAEASMVESLIEKLDQIDR